MFFKQRFLISLLLALCSLSAFAELRMPAVFTDHMVLQADQAIPVWGWGEPDSTVRVAFAGKTASAAVGKDGKWKLHLEALPASFEPKAMTITSSNGDPAVAIIDILIGEVWLCSGQSNMWWSVAESKDAAQVIRQADFPQIRLFCVPPSASPEPLDDVTASWQLCSPQSVGSFSAVGYFFGRKLHEDLNAPVGLVQLAFRGTPVSSFMDQETVENTAFNRLIYGHDKKQMGAKNPKLNCISSHCYNAMVHPVIPFAARGVIWYQGEANAAATKPYIQWYTDYVKMMRRKFNNSDMPFYHVQLAGWEHPKIKWAKFRLAQEATLQIPNTGMVTAMDLGERDDIHPKNKQEVGRRLALCALNQTYDKTDVVCRGPQFTSLRKEGSSLVVTFSHCEGGLKLRGEFGGFEGVLADGSVVPLSGKISGLDTVTLDVGGQAIQQLRYAYANYPLCPLYNAAGLPALSFEQPVL